MRIRESARIRRDKKRLEDALAIMRQAREDIRELRSPAGTWLKERYTLMILDIQAKMGGMAAEIAAAEYREREEDLKKDAK